MLSLARSPNQVLGAPESATGGVQKISLNDQDAISIPEKHLVVTFLATLFTSYLGIAMHQLMLL